MARAARRATRAARDGDDDQERARARACARSHAAGRVFRHRALSLLRGRRAGGAENAALADAAAGRQSRTGPARDAARAREAACCSAAKRTISCTGCILVRTSAGARARTAAGTRRALSVEPTVPPAHRRSAARRPPRSRRPASRRGSTLLDRAAAGRVEFAPMAAVRARIGLARELIALSQASRAIDLLAPVIRCAADRAVRRGGARAIRRSDARTNVSAIAIARVDRVRRGDRSGAIRRSGQHSIARARANRARPRTTRLTIKFLTIHPLLCLTSQNFSTIIYIWYEGGELRPSLVRLERQPRPSAPGPFMDRRGGATKRRATVVG